jgi:hypothetical protein
VKGLILAAVSMIFLIFFCSVALRISRDEREYRVFLAALAGALAIYVSLFAISPANLWVLSPALIEPAAVVDFLNGAIVLVAVFLGFWAFAYAACLGPTMTVLRALEREREGGMTAHEVSELFGGGEPMSDILRRRLPKLVNGGYAVEAAGRYTLKSRGGRIAKVLISLQRLVAYQGQAGDGNYTWPRG